MVMENKICIVGKQNAGKTVMLKCLIALMWQHVDTNKWAIINGVYHPNVPTNPFQPKPQVEYRVVFWYQSPLTGNTKLVAISTKGDAREDIIKNWELFLGSSEAKQTQQWYANNNGKWIVPNLCISPCHLADATRDEEEHQHHMVRTNILRFIWQSIEQIPTNKFNCSISFEELTKMGALMSNKKAKQINVVLQKYVNQAAALFDFIENHCM